MRLGHVTDLHVADVRDYPLPDEARYHARIAKHSEALLEKLLADLATQRPDRVAVTGDLTQTAKREEFERARSLFDRHLPGVPLSIVPGNHDVWTREAAEQRYLARAFAEHVGPAGFPLLHVDDGVALVGLDSSPFVAGVDPARVLGEVSKDQLAALDALGGDPRLAKRFVVVLLHHHLRLSAVDAAAEDPKDPTPLANAPEVEEALARLRPDLVLHGHRHQQMRLDLPLGDRLVPVLCPGSASRLHARADRTARYALYEIEGGALGAVRTRAFDAAANRFVEAPSMSHP